MNSKRGETSCYIIIKANYSNTQNIYDLTNTEFHKREYKNNK